MLAAGDKVKRGNLERNLGFGICFSRKFCWILKQCLPVCTADQLLQVQKLVGEVTWNASCLDM